MRKPSADPVERLVRRTADFPGGPHFIVVSVGDVLPSRVRDLFLHDRDLAALSRARHCNACPFSERGHA